MNKHLDIISLIAANLVSIFMAIYFKWDLWNLMLIYWCQSVIIGIFTFAKLLSAQVPAYQNTLDEGTTLEINGVRKNDPAILKLVMCIFFPLHYGAFHFGYLMYLLTSKFFDLASGNPSISFITTLSGVFSSLLIGTVPVLIFLLNHWYSFSIYKQRGQSTDISIISTFWKPYLRVLPMNAAVVLGGFAIGFSNNSNIGALMAFMILKTIADVFLHIWEHKPVNNLPGVTV